MMKQEFGIIRKKSLKKQRDRQKKEWLEVSKLKTESVLHNGRLIMSRKNSVIGEKSML